MYFLVQNLSLSFPEIVEIPAKTRMTGNQVLIGNPVGHIRLAWYEEKGHIVIENAFIHCKFRELRYSTP